MTLLFSILATFLAAFGAGFFVGVGYGVWRENERWERNLKTVERLRDGGYINI